MNRMLFVYADLRPGGIETLIVRTANFLAGQRRTIAICVSGGELLGQISKNVDVLSWSDRKDAAANAVAWIGRSSEPVTMISFDPISAALGLAIEVRNANRVPLTHLSGIYHPRAYFMTGERRDRKLLNRLVARAVGDRCIFYMNAECRAEHERLWQTALGDCRIIPIPIEERGAKWRAADSEVLRIVSVGRLVDFKAYNLAAARIAQECRKRGVPVKWDIYGTGPLDEAIRRSIERESAAGMVELKGQLPYERFARTVAGYDLFIGMGTAALEAAMIGVSTIVATESEARRSYGFVHELPFANVGERQGFLPPHDLADLIRSYATADSAARQAIAKACRAAVRDYSAKHWIEEVDGLARERTPIPPMTFKKAVSALYECMTASRLAGFVRRL